MICPKYFIDELVKRNVQLFSGVPCSYVTPLINEVIEREDTDYVIVSSEGEALSLASGAWLGGVTSAVLCQNSGLGNMVNPLTSLNAPFGIPVLLLITWRGKPGQKDEPQHEVMGKIMTDLLDLMGVQWCFFPKNKLEIPDCLDTVLSTIRKSNRPFAMILENDSFISKEKLENEVKKKSEIDVPKITANSNSELPGREEILKVFLKHITSDSPIIATTGKTGRELFTLRDDHNHLYCVGSMGYANALAHGLALTTRKKVFVIDGDGSAIMHLGNLTSIGARAAHNLVHIILDNGSYDSTGGQSTVSDSVNFVEIAKSCGYKKAVNCVSLETLIVTLKELSKPGDHGPFLIYMKIKKGSIKKLGRPTETPYAVARRFQNFLKKA